MQKYYVIKGGDAQNVLFTPSDEWVRFAFERAGIEEYFEGAKGAVYLAYGAFPFLTASTINEAFAAFEKKGRALSVMAGGVLIGAVVDADDYREEKFDYLCLYARGKIRVHYIEGQSASNKAELLELNNLARSLTVQRLCEKGVEFTDASGVSISPYAVIESGAVIHKGTIIKGKCVIGEGAQIGPDTVIEDSVIGEGAVIKQSVVEKSIVGAGVTMGPYSHLRPKTELGENVHIGNFVEVKNSKLGKGTKAGHLTYIGDCDCGENVNWGCGCVVVNYDGKHKFRSTIGDNAFIGSNTKLVSPVTVGEGALTAAGSTITDDVPEGKMAIARSRQSIHKRKIIE